MDIGTHDRQPTVQTLDSLSPSLIDAIRRIPAHDEARSPKSLLAHRPARIFTDPAHFEREQRAIFKRHPVPVGVSAQLPGPQMVQAVNAYGVPLLLTRNAAGELKVFLNVCRHKGSLVVERPDAYKGGRVSCPYHAWTYNLDGALVGVPRQEVFGDFRKDEHGLVRLAAVERGGVIWAVMDRNAPADFAAINDALVADWESLNLPRLHLYGHKTFELHANWKLVIEPFLEGYHVQRLHAATVGPLFADVPTVSSMLGDHIRQVSGKADFNPEVLKSAQDSIHKTVTITYLAFPNVSVITSPYYVSVMLIQPRAANQTTVQYYMLTRDPADNDRARELFQRSYDMVLNVFGNEDFRAASISQTGLESGAIDQLVYGGLESQIPAFYDVIDRHLGAASTA